MLACPPKWCPHTWRRPGPTSSGIAVIAATVIAVAGAVALSPLAPIGEVRGYDPARGVQVDGLVVGGGSALLILLLGGLLGWLAWRTVRRAGEPLPARSAAVAVGASRLGLPGTVTTGVRHAHERGAGRLRAPARASLAGSAAAVAALAAALVFSASLSGLVSHPQLYGWNWTVLIQSRGGWGSWPPAAMARLGMRRGQLRSVVASLAAVIMALAVLAGVPIGVAFGRWAWVTFANAIGVVPAPAVPATELVVGVVGLIAAGVLLALWPAAVAARTSPAVVLRSE
jgi:hypothetical protein